MPVITSQVKGDMRQEVRTELVDRQIEHRMAKEVEAMGQLNETELGVAWHHGVTPRAYLDSKNAGGGSGVAIG